MNKKNRDRFKRMPLSCKYCWHGMSKTNYRKHNKGRRFIDLSEGELVSLHGTYKDWLNKQ
jgi:hypothetical protein